MVLIIEKKVYSTRCTLENLFEHEELMKSSRQFALTEEVLQPNEEIPKTIYISQREFAVLSPNDRHQFRYLGSDDATTCHIMILDNQSAIALVHLDGSHTQESVERIINELNTYSTGNSTVDVYLVGGFIDNSSRDYSRALSNEILDLLSRDSSLTFHLKLSAITNFNDQIRNGIHYPLIYGVCIDIQTKHLRKMKFVDLGPAFRLRSVYQSVDDHPAWCVYSSSKGNIQLQKFVIERYLVENYFQRLYRSYFHDDQLLLKKTSTSPEQERSTYVLSMKKNILYILKYWKDIPQWFDSKTNLISYERDGNQWITADKKIIDDIEVN